jgi:rhodanese-related sulfurtransferase
MEWIIILVGLYLLLVMMKKMKSSKVNSITAAELDVMLKDKTTKRQFVDVRTNGEFSNQKIKGFKNIPVDSLHKRSKELDPNMPVVLMCASGSRSLRAANILTKVGFSDISHLKGGLLTYNRS